MVHYISPYRTDKNIGRAINEAIRHLDCRSDDWVIHTDMDLLWLRPDSKKQLEEILLSTDYDILGVMLNRLGNDYQLARHMFNETNILEHYKEATRRHSLNYGQVIDFPAGPMAAAVMCFKVQTWKDLGGFDENSLAFDTQFCIRAVNSNYQLGLCTGIYCFHYYRLHKEVNNIDHLL